MYIMVEYTLNTSVVDYSHTNFDPSSNTIYLNNVEKFDNFLRCGDLIGYEVDSDGKRLGVFISPKDLKFVPELKDIEKASIIGMFVTSDNNVIIRIITNEHNFTDFDPLLTRKSYDLGNENSFSMEISATNDVHKFISDEEVQEYKNQLSAKSFSHIKVKDGKLAKIYFWK